ncbi:MAG TPA: protein kinase [Chloroflexia bacterium]
MDTLVGRRLGKYHLESLLGRGGMATVYRAHDTVLNRAVAIKVLDPALAIDPKAVERFKREAVTAANLEHPNIVRVYDVQQDGSLHYISMRYVQGTTLRDILQDNGPLPLETAVNVIAPVAQALHYAHKNGVIHRDVKPGNILVEPDGLVVLSDFGIARAAGAGQAGLTATGLVMGTADYLAPEQISGRPAEQRSDIYSLGVVLYEMLTGVTPFAGENTASVLYRQVHDAPPPLRSMNPHLPQELQPIIDRALAKNPTLRYSDALDLARDLEEVARWLPQGGPWLKARPGTNGAGNATRYVPQPAAGYDNNAQHWDGGQQTINPYVNEIDPPYEVYEQFDPHVSYTRTPEQRGRGRRTVLLFFALLLVALGVVVMAAGAGVFPLRIGQNGQAGNGGTNRFQAPGPTTYSGPVRTGNGPDIHVPRSLQPITIDGDVSDWAGAEQWAVPAADITYINEKVRDLRWEGPNDLSATFNFAWDDANFYIGAVVTDDVHVQTANTRSYSLYNGDDIEIWFDLDLAGDFNAAAGNGDDFQLGLSPGDFASHGPEAVFWNPDRDSNRNKLVTVRAQRRPANNGYVIEAMLPWAAFGNFRPQPGMGIGFVASAGDNDNPDPARQELMTSTGNRLQYKQPLTFGMLYL